MLEQLRQQSRSFIIWILFGIIILVFIISFGPQANAELGCGASDTVALEVNGKAVDDTAWRYAINGLPQLRPDLARGRSREQRANMAMDLLLARELLAQEGEAAGFRISDDLINDKLRAGEWYFLGAPGGPEAYFVDGYFSFEALERFAQNLGLTTVEAFRDQQRRELLADAARSLVIGGVNVSREEVLAQFQHDNTVASIDYVRFSTINYKRIVLTDAQIDAYLAENTDAVEKKYDAEAVNYKETKPAVKLRQILVAVKDDTDAAATAEAQKKADELHASIVGGADFAAVATESSADTLTAPRGGLLGWRRVDRPGLPDQKLSDAIATLDKGAVSAVIQGPRGFYILKVEDKREGDLSFDQVKHELAEGLAVDHFARKAARADAEAALALVKEGKDLDDLFEEAPPQFDPEMLREQLGLPPGTSREDIIRILQQSMDTQPKSGAVVVHGPAIPAEWQDGEGAKPAPAAVRKPAPPKPATTAAEPKVEVKPKARPKVEAKPAKAPAAGAADDAAAGKFESPDDGLPRPDGLVMPKVQTAGPFNRDLKTVEGLGDNADAVIAIFEEIDIGTAAPTIFEFGDDFVILKVISRREPDLDTFIKREPELLQQARLEKAADLLGEWQRDACKKAAENGDVSVNKELLTFQDDNGKNLPVTYSACQFF